MFIMSGLSTKEWERVLLVGSSGWSILKEPPPLLTVPVTTKLPARKPLPLASTANTCVKLLPEFPCNNNPDPEWDTNRPAVPLGLSTNPDTPMVLPDGELA